MPEDHAKLSPSGAERWMKCPGSMVLSEGMPQQTSKYADEGTRAHTMAEAWLNGTYKLANPTGSKSHDTAISEMEKHIRVYVEHVSGLRNGSESKVHVEVQVKVTANCWGTADAIVWDPKTCTLFVRDLKYGAGVGVEVRGNLQLKIYALAALLTMGYPAKNVNVGIVQPRFPHSDGVCRSVDFDAVDLIDFHADLVDGAGRVRDAFARAEDMAKVQWNEEFLVPSEKGCRWCLAAPKCPKLKAKAQDVAKQVFAPAMPYDAKDLADTLDLLPILEGWIKNTREFAYNEAEAGRVPPTYKLVEKRASRKWKEGVEFLKVAMALKVLGTDVITPSTLRPVGEILKMAPGKNAAEREAVLAPFTVKESSGHTLVHESDPRDPVRLDAKAAFSGDPQ